MASLTDWTWVWVDSGSWWWTGRPGVLQFMESQRVGHDWVTELNWTRIPVSGRLNLLINFLNIYLCIGQSSVMRPLTLSQIRTSSFLSVFICLLTWVFRYFEQNESSINKKELKMPFWLNNRIHTGNFMNPWNMKTSSGRSFSQCPLLLFSPGTIFSWLWCAWLTSTSTSGLP